MCACLCERVCGNVCDVRLSLNVRGQQQDYIYVCATTQVNDCRGLCACFLSVKVEEMFVFNVKDVFKGIVHPKQSNAFL